MALPDYLWLESGAQIFANAPPAVHLITCKECIFHRGVWKEKMKGIMEKLEGKVLPTNSAAVFTDYLCICNQKKTQGHSIFSGWY